MAKMSPIPYEHAEYVRRREHGKWQRLQILKCLSDDHSLLQAAEYLGLSYSAIKYHLEFLRDESNCKNMAGLIGWAFRNKLVE